MNVIVITEYATVEARREDPEGPWEIGYPWGDRRFYGSAVSVKAEINRQLKERQNDQAK